MIKKMEMLTKIILHDVKGGLSFEATINQGEVIST